MKSIALLLLLLPLPMIAQQVKPSTMPMYYETHEGDEWYWKEHSPFIRPRGICAEMHVGNASKPAVWVLTPVVPNPDYPHSPSIYHFGEAAIFATQHEAEKAAESYCPTEAPQQPNPPKSTVNDATVHPEWSAYGTVKMCARDGDKDCIGFLSVTTDSHGCQEWTGFSWDEGTKTCRINFTIQKQPAMVTCSPLGKPDENGNQHAVCWYVPPPRNP